VALTPGTRIGSYEVAALIGEGGMGEVYRATDTHLGRDVAIKVLPDTFSQDSERLARFEREAKMLGSLNHPNIAIIHGVERADASAASAQRPMRALVMEFVEGPTLADRIAQGPVPIEEALPIAKQIADALEAAHEQGIIHRDLKPANIKIRPDGTVKVLDFGLAKTWEPTGVTSHGRSQSPTITTPAMTQAGVILGTAAYMSPEQARGNPVDKRADIWAFGAVLYEMLTGRRAFGGDEVSDVLASVLAREPDWTILPAACSPVLVTYLKRCLSKDRRQRIRDIGDVSLAVTGAFETARHDAPPQAVAQPVWRQALPVAMTALVAILVTGLAAWGLWPRAAPGSLSRFEAPVPENVTLSDDVSVSPDGRKLVFAADGLWLRDFDALEWRRLPGTEGASTPFWSPDSRYVGFTVDNEVSKIDTTGGPPETMASLPNTPVAGGGTWNLNGDIVLGSWGGGSGGPLWRVSQAGGAARAVTEVDVSKGELYHTWPTFLPDNKHFLYFRSGPPDVEGMYVGSLDVDAGDQSRQRILTSNVPAVYANGFVFFPRAGTLMAQAFDPRRLELQGVPVPVAQDVQVTWYSTGVFSVSGNGVLVYRTASASGTSQLAWFDRQGKTLSTFGPPGTDTRVALSPDGKRAVVKDAPYGVPGDLWTLDFASGRRTRFTFHKEVYSPGVWAPDSTRIVYSAGRLGDTLYEKAASGLGDEQVLFKEPGLRHFPTSWSRDGRFLLYHTENAPRTGYDLWALSLRDRRPHLMLGEAFNEWAGVFSPDMRWVAYVSLETGAQAGVYVRPFRVSGQTGQPSLGEGKWQVSKDHGNWPQWRVDREIVFNTAPTGTAVFAAPVNPNGAVFESGVPERLPLPPNVGVDSTPQSTADGQRLLVEVSQVQRAARPSISVVLNWPVLLKEVK